MSSPPSVPDQALLRLLQLASPALPVGGFAYSQGLEYACHAGWIQGESSLYEWLSGLLEHSLGNVDVPLFGLSYAAWQRGDVARVREHARFLLACRETAELRSEERQLGRSLARCLAALDVTEASPWLASEEAAWLTLFSLASVKWGIALRTAALGYLMAWAQNQVSAALRLLPVGQLAGQRLLSELVLRMPRVLDAGLAIRDESSVGFTAPAQVVASALHETQYSRLFRS